jgi:hypothetical protein
VSSDSSSSTLKADPSVTSITEPSTTTVANTTSSEDQISQEEAAAKVGMSTDAEVGQQEKSNTESLAQITTAESAAPTSASLASNNAADDEDSAFAEDTGKLGEMSAKNAQVVMRQNKGRLCKASSVDDINSGDFISRTKRGEDDDDEAVCVVDGTQVVSFLHKSQTLPNPAHLKTSLSDNALLHQQQPSAVLQDAALRPKPSPVNTGQGSEATPFARLKQKMSALTVPRVTSAQGRGENVLNISKSHIRKSQRAMEVFERLVQDKLKGADCESRIIFI